jgi:hypothetical protein
MSPGVGHKRGDRHSSEKEADRAQQRAGVTLGTSPSASSKGKSQAEGKANPPGGDHSPAERKKRGLGGVEHRGMADSEECDTHPRRYLVMDDAIHNRAEHREQNNRRELDAAQTP